jgi:hypothetical protein
VRVNPSANNASVDQVRTSTEAPKQAGSGAPAAATTGSDSLGRSGDLNRLLSTLAELPDVREDVLAMVRAKMEAGELAQKSAVAAAAAGIVDGAAE